MAENDTEVTIHHLVEKDLSTMTGNCSVCGFVAIAKSGRGFQCDVKKKANTASWRERNPERSNANRRRRSDHELFGRDYLALTAKCVKCGPVSMTPWGRGYTCSTRANELRAVQEEKPATPCRECWLLDGDRVYLVNGACPRCDDPRLYDTGAQLRDSGVGYSARELPDGFTVTDISVDYDVPEYESAVPGWRTVGSDRPWNEA